MPLFRSMLGVVALLCFAALQPKQQDYSASSSFIFVTAAVEDDSSSSAELSLWKLLYNSVFCYTREDKSLSSSSSSSNDSDMTIIPDCTCNVNSVHEAVNDHLSPLLANLTSRTFFRYYFVDLEKECPFWNEEGQCMMEGCSVCSCDELEVPKPWLKLGLDEEEKRRIQEDKEGKFDGEGENSFGWVTSPSRNGNYLLDIDDDPLSLGRVSSQDLTKSPEVEIMKQQLGKDRYSQYLRESQKDEQEDWTAMCEEIEVESHCPSGGSYVNLLENPEQYTGFRGPTAERVWRSISVSDYYL
jgi:hypothetical protein